jgi:hypothetical protein
LVQPINRAGQRDTPRNHDPYSGPLSLDVTVRPARVAYLIRAGSRAGFRRAIQEATTRWCGMTELIIPVRHNGSVDAGWSQMVHTANLDAAVNVDATASAAHAAAEALHLGVTDIADIDRAGEGKWTCHPAFVAGSAGPPFMIPGRGADLRQATIAGDLTDEDEASLPADLAWIRRVKEPDMLSRADLLGSTALAAGLVPSRPAWTRGEYGRTPAIVWLAGTRSFMDCLWFWNLRALRPDPENTPMYLVQADQFEGWLNYTDQLRDRLRRPDNVHPDVVIAGLKLPENTLREFGRKLGLRYSTDDIGVGWHSPERLRDVAATFTTSNHIDPLDWLLAERRYGATVGSEVHVFVGTGTLRVATPIKWTRDLAGYAMLSIRSPEIEHYPKRPSVAAAILSNGTWRDGGVEIRTNVLSTYDLPVTLPTMGDAIWMTLREVSDVAKLSDKGQLASALLPSADALLEPGMYEAAMALATPRKHALLNELDSRSAKGATRAELEQLAERWGGNAQRAFLNALDVNQQCGPQTQAALEQLCAIEWAERGFEVRCSVCTVRSFVALSETASRSRCPACGAQQPYTTRPRNRTPELFYRLGSLHDRAAGQGVLPHLLVTAALRRSDPSSHLLPGVLLSIGGVNMEVDVFGVHLGRVIAGEIKTDQSQFTRKQMVKDLQKSRDLGADLHLLAAADDVTDEVRHEVEDLARSEGMDTLVLDRTNLRPARHP